MDELMHGTMKVSDVMTCRRNRIRRYDSHDCRNRRNLGVDLGSGQDGINSDAVQLIA